MKYLIVFNQTQGEDEVEHFEGTLEEAIKESTHSARHWDYGRRGVKIYEISEPVYVKMERD